MTLKEFKRAIRQDGTFQLLYPQHRLEYVLRQIEDARRLGQISQGQMIKLTDWAADKYGLVTPRVANFLAQRS